MKSVGERIRQAREFRKMSGEELAHQSGYKHQSGISNIENRATGTGGNNIVKIAKALDFALQWFLNGPDTDDMNTVPPFSADAETTHRAREPEPPSITYQSAHNRRHTDANLTWPFKQISPMEYATLSPHQQTMIEGYVRGLLLENKLHKSDSANKAA